MGSPHIIPGISLISTWGPWPWGVRVSHLKGNEGPLCHVKHSPMFPDLRIFLRSDSDVGGTKHEQPDPLVRDQDRGENGHMEGTQGCRPLCWESWGQNSTFCHLALCFKSFSYVHTLFTCSIVMKIAKYMPPVTCSNVWCVVHEANTAKTHTNGGSAKHLMRAGFHL